MKLKYLQNNASGVISIYVLTLLILYATLGLTVLGLQMGAFQDTRNLQDEAQARYLAQTAMQEARYYSSYINTTWSGTSPEMQVTIGTTGVGTYQYQTTAAGNAYTVNATGYVPNSTAKKKYSYTQAYTYYNPNPYVIFSDGFESGNLTLKQWTESTASPCETSTDWDVVTSATSPPKNGTYVARGRKTGSSGTRTACLLTPVFNLAGYSSVVLRFVWRAYTNGSSIRVSQNSGSGWSAIYTDSSNNYNSAYTRPSIKLSISNLTSTVQFRFEANSSSTSGQAYLLDDVMLVSPAAYYDSTVD